MTNTRDTKAVIKTPPATESALTFPTPNCSDILTPLEQEYLPCTLFSSKMHDIQLLPITKQKANFPSLQWQHRRRRAGATNAPYIPQALPNTCNEHRSLRGKLLSPLEFPPLTDTKLSQTDYKTKLRSPEGRYSREILDLEHRKNRAMHSSRGSDWYAQVLHVGKMGNSTGRSSNKIFEFQY